MRIFNSFSSLWNEVSRSTFNGVFDTYGSGLSGSDDMSLDRSIEELDEEIKDMFGKNHCVLKDFRTERYFSDPKRLKEFTLWAKDTLGLDFDPEKHIVKEDKFFKQRSDIQSISRLGCKSPVYGDMSDDTKKLLQSMERQARRDIALCRKIIQDPNTSNAESE